MHALLFISGAIIGTFFGLYLSDAADGHVLQSLALAIIGLLVTGGLVVVGLSLGRNNAARWRAVLPGLRGKWTRLGQSGNSAEKSAGQPSVILRRILFFDLLQNARTRPWLFASGLGVAAFGQVALNRSDPVLPISSIYDRLDSIFRLQFSNREAPLEGLVILLLGGFLFSLGVRGVRVWNDRTLEVVPNNRGPSGNQLPLKSLLALLALSLILSFYVWITLHNKTYEASLPVIWICSLLALGLFFFQFDRRRGISLAIPCTRREGIAIVLVVVTGLIVLSYRLSDLPPVIWGDEGAHWDVAWGIATGRPDANIFDFGVYSFPLLHSYYVAAFTKLFGYTIFAWRMSSVVAGVAALVPTYFLGRDLFNKRVGILAAVLMIVSPLFLVYARMGYHLMLSVFPVVCALWLFHLAWERRSLFLAFLSGLTNGLGLYTYSPAEASVFIVGVYGLFLVMTRKLGLRSMLALGASFGLTVVLVYGPHLVWGLAVSPETLSYKTAEGVFNNVFQVRALFADQDPYQYYPPINVYGQTLFFNPPLYAKLLTRGFLRTLVAFNDEGIMRDHFVSTSMAGPVAAVFFLAGLVYIHMRLRKESLGLIAIWFWVCFFFLNVLNQTPPRPTHSMPLIPLIAILTALALYLVANFASKFLSSRVAFASVGVIVMVIFSAGLWQYYVISQDLVRPELESLMTFAELDATAPTEVVYLYEGNPRNYLFAPWAIEHFDTKATFELLPLAELSGKRDDFDARDVHYYFFASPNIADKALSVLSGMFNSGRSQKYWANGGRFIGVSYKVD